jgi:hypothetical protein
MINGRISDNLVIYLTDGVDRVGVDETGKPIFKNNPNKSGKIVIKGTGRNGKITMSVLEYKKLVEFIEQNKEFIKSNLKLEAHKLKETALKLESELETV